jgi:hypothetical protein
MGKLQAVWGTSPHDLYIVGEGGTLHSTGNSMWTAYTTGSAWLTAISGVPGTLVSAGLQGTIFRGAGGDTFVEERSGTIDERLRGVAVVPGDAFVVGEGLLLHSSGGGPWQDETPASRPWLEAAWGAPTAGIWAVGLSGAILHR